MNPQSLIAQNVREWRKFRRLSQQELADRTRLTRTHISNIERGRGNLTVETVYHLAQAFNCEVHEILPTLRDATQSVKQKEYP